MALFFSAEKNSAVRNFNWLNIGILYFDTTSAYLPAKFTIPTMRYVKNFQAAITKNSFYMILRLFLLYDTWKYHSILNKTAINIQCFVGNVSENIYYLQGVKFY